MNINEQFPNMKRVFFTRDLNDGDKVALDNFKARFDTEAACADFLFVQKWPQGFICSRCKNKDASRIDNRRLPLFQCNNCHYQSSLTVGTIMEGSSTDLRKWFIAMFLVSATEFGINALRLSELIKVTYKTAWLILRKIRQSITHSDERVQLSGTVHIDKGRCGNFMNTAMYSEPTEFPLLIGAATDENNQPTYIKIQMVSKALYNDFRILPEGIEAFREQHIDLDATVTSTIGTRTKHNAMKGYPFFKKAIEWIKHTYHGLSQAHQQHYWNEFCWRINTNLLMLPVFESMLKLCANSQTIPYTKLTKLR